MLSMKRKDLSIEVKNELLGAQNLNKQNFMHA